MLGEQMQLQQASLALNIRETINLRGAERLKRTLVSIHGVPLVSSGIDSNQSRAALGQKNSSEGAALGSTCGPGSGWYCCTTLSLQAACVALWHPHSL